MKVTELMVGDWVICHHPTCEPKQAQVTVGLLHCLEQQDLGFQTEESPLFRIVEPIPLTAEILEKNGFERTNDYHFFDGDEYYEMELRELSDSIWLVEFTDLEFSMPSQRMIVCNVHELQHALRLCGIEKEIEL